MSIAKKLISTSFISLTISLLFSVLTFAINPAQKGYVTLPDGVKRYAEYTAPTGNKPTVILINGLVYEMDRWQPYSESFKKAGYGVLNYYFRGQHLTLKKEAEGGKTPAFFQTGLESKNFGVELEALTTQLKLKAPFIVVGLSYGANIAAQFATQFPTKVSNLFIMSPLVQPLSAYDPAGAWLGWNLDAIKLWWGPIFGPTFYEMAYQQIYRSYLNQRIVPERVPPELSQMVEVYKESSFQLVRAVRDFDLKKFHFEKLKKGTVHFFLAHEEDQKVFADQVAAFDSVASSSKGILVYLPQAAHAIPDTHGAAAAELTNMLLSSESKLKAGAKYYVDDKGQILVWKN